MITPNRIAAGVLIAFSLFYGYLTLQLPDRVVMGEPGSALFPGILTVLLLLLSGLLIVQDVRGKALPRTFDIKITPGVRKAIIMFVLTFFYQLLMPYIGFIVSSILFFGVIMWLGGDHRRIPIVAYSVGLTLLLWVFFKEIFQIPLPVGSLLKGVF